MIVTIDGPAAAGKGTLAARLAEKYKLAYFDTGMVYRAVGLEMFLNGEDVSDEVQAEKTAKELTFQKMTALAKHPEFRGAVGGKNASIVSAHPKVRQALLKMQQDFAKNPVLQTAAKRKVQFTTAETPVRSFVPMQPSNCLLRHPAKFGPAPL